MSFRAAAIAAIALCLVVGGTAVREVRASPSASEEPIRCTCREGNACYHWLNAPVAPPVDPCSCPNCRANRGSCARIYPSDWNPDCARSARLECFLRRHAASWKLVCSEEMGDCECPGSDSASCPACAEGGKPPNPKRFDVIRKQLAIEHKVLPEGRFIVLTSPHFYLVSDLTSLKVLTQNGSRRELGAHEIAHLFAQRAEIAYRDFTRALGDDIRTSRPVAIFLTKKKRDSERLQAEYFARANAGLVYGLRGEGTPLISGGIAEAGLALALEAQTSDEALHVTLRTFVGHVLMSLWESSSATPAHLPMWVFVGAGHWLGRLPALFADEAAFVGGEGNAPTDGGRKWLERLAKAQAKSDFPHVETFLGYTTLSQTDLTANMRAWSWFALFLEEDHDRFVKLLRLVRDGTNQRDAIRDVFGCSPDELDQRLRERVTGKRKSLVDKPGTAPVGSSPGAPSGGFADLAKESDARTVADRIKARRAIDDPQDAAALVALLDRDVDLIRERVVLALAKARAEPVREYLRGEALEKSHGHVKAGVVRILGLAKDKDAAEDLTALLADPDPEIRAQAAVAIGHLKEEPAIPGLRRLLADRSDEVAMATMDALAEIGEAAGDEAVRVTPRLEDSHRTVRTAAAECLAALGSMEAVEPLIARMEKESGRVRNDIRDALRRITRDDLGADPTRWRKWWDKEKERAAGKLPTRPQEPAEKPAESRYAEAPKFYGVEIFSQRLAFVLDVSSSMSDRIVVDPSWMGQEKRVYRNSGEKYDLAVDEITATLRAVDPRLEFGIITFRSEVRSWKEHLVPAGTGNVDQALGYLASQHPAPMADSGDPARQKTNLADALRIAFGIRPGTSGRPSEETADEVYVMTDGQPTAGDLTDADVLLSWFRERNRIARLRLHVVTFGTVDVDLTFLRNLAAAGRGQFVVIPTKR